MDVDSIEMYAVTFGGLMSEVEFCSERVSGGVDIDGSQCFDQLRKIIIKEEIE